MLPTKFRFIWPSGFRREDLKINRPIGNKNCLCRPCLVMDHNKMCTLNRGHSMDASYQVSVHLAKQFQRRRFFTNRAIRNKNCMWWQCLLTDRDEMSNLHRGHSIDASYQVLVIVMFTIRSGRNEQSSYILKMIPTNFWW